VHGGEFVSSTDVPDKWQSASAECLNKGLWPVLIGTAAERDTMLASPIILYDYPQLAPESPGNLFDSTEIDEILTLRILTLTDDEKRMAASVDARARDLLARTDALGEEQLMNLHGTIRGLRPAASVQEQTHG
jgi:hydrogenase maturation protease